MTIFMFDVDGVLVDSKACVLESYAEVLAEHGVHDCHSILESIWGKPWKKVCETLRHLVTPFATASVKDLSKFCDARRELFKTNLENGEYELKAKKGIRALWDSTPPAKRMIVTSGSPVITGLKLKSAGYETSNATTMYGVDKSEKSFWEYVSESFPNQNLILIDDNVDNCNAAESAGVATILIGED